MADKKFIRIAITPPYFYKNEAGYIESVLRNDKFDFVHIRKPDATSVEMDSLIRDIDPDMRHRLTLHSHFEMASQNGIGGIHLNSRNPLRPEKWHGRVSISLHSIEECSKAEDYTYATLSPIYSSLSKPGYSNSFNRHELDSMLKSERRVPIIALGGITDDLTGTVEDAGFDGAAMLSGAWRTNIDIDKFKLQFITHPSSETDAIRQVREAIEGGCRWVQLRWKNASEQQIISAGKEIADICRKHNLIFILDDHVELVEICGADGVHLGKNDMAISEARHILGPHTIIGATANTTDDIMEALRSGADYIGYGPFRFTTTKKNLSPVLGLNGYRLATGFLKENGISAPIVAIGGITASDISEVIRTGVNGIAMSGCIINAHDPIAETAGIINLINQSK